MVRVRAGVRVRARARARVGLTTAESPVLSRAHLVRRRGTGTGTGTGRVRVQVREWVRGRVRVRVRTPHLGCHGTRTQYVQCVAPWGQAALRLWYVPYAGGWYALRRPGAYVSAQAARQSESRRCDVHRRPWQHSEQRPREQLSSRLLRSRQSAHAAKHTSPQSAITRSKPNPG